MKLVHWMVRGRGGGGCQALDTWSERKTGMVFFVRRFMKIFFYRPRLFKIEGSTDILIENLFFLNSPYWTCVADGMDGLEIRNCEIR